MQEQALFEGINFPAVPREPIEERDIVRLAVAAYTGLSELYSELVRRAAGDRRAILGLLAGDWTLRSRSLLESSRELLSSPTREPGAGRRVEPFAAKELASRIAEHEIGEILSAVEATAERSAVCTKLVPLGDASEKVQQFFRRCVEAEDLHCAQIAWAREVLAAAKLHGASSRHGAESKKS